MKLLILPICAALINGVCGANLASITGTMLSASGRISSGFDSPGSALNLAGSGFNIAQTHNSAFLSGRRTEQIHRRPDAHSITAQEVADYIYASGVEYPEIVLRQAIMETGWFKSKHLMGRNNLFGFRSTKTYMRFETWQKSVDYYKNWQHQRYKNHKEDYYAFLVRIRYASSPVYISKLKSIKLRNVVLPPGPK